MYIPCANVLDFKIAEFLSKTGDILCLNEEKATVLFRCCDMVDALCLGEEEGDYEIEVSDKTQEVLITIKFPDLIIRSLDSQVCGLLKCCKRFNVCHAKGTALNVVFVFDDLFERKGDS